MRKYAYVSGADDCLVPGLHARLFDAESVMDERSAARCPQVFIRSGAGGVILPRSSGRVVLQVRPWSRRPVRAEVYVRVVEARGEAGYAELVRELESQAVYV